MGSHGRPLRRAEKEGDSGKTRVFHPVSGSWPACLIPDVQRTFQWNCAVSSSPLARAKFFWSMFQLFHQSGSHAACEPTTFGTMLLCPLANMMDKERAYFKAWALICTEFHNNRASGQGRLGSFPKKKSGIPIVSFHRSMIVVGR